SMDGPKCEKGRAYDGPPGLAFAWVYAKAPRTDGVYVTRSEADALGPWDIDSTKATVGSLGKPAVEVRMTEDGARRLAELSARGAGHKLAVLLDGALLVAPQIQGEIKGGKAVIDEGSSGVTPEEMAK